jgi:inosose dehydratase
MNRRHTLAWMTSAGVTALVPSQTVAAAPRIRWSHGWLLWRGQKQTLRQAILDLATIGASGIEYSPIAGAPEKDGFSQQALLTFLKEHGLTIPGMYFPVGTSDRSETLTAARVRMASMKAYGASCMVMAPPDSKSETQNRNDAITRLAPTLNEIGRIAREEGLQAGLHPHLNTLIETRAEIDLAMRSTDPKLVHFSADTGHLHLAGCDVLATLKRYASRLNYLHFKDGVRPFVRPDFSPNLRELGRGEVDFPSVMRFLAKRRFQGWINVEQDSSKLTALEAATASMAFVNKTLRPIYT